MNHHSAKNALFTSRESMKLIIFDCDGTLVDSELLCHLGMQQQLAEFGFVYDAHELMANYRGIKLNVTIASLADKFNTSFPATFEAEYRSKVRELFDKQLNANAGVAELLASLTIPFCVASSAPREKIEHALHVTGLDKYFINEDGNNIFSSYEISSWKPEPGIFLHAASMMNTDPVDCYVIEDSVVGLQAANSAKMTSVYYAPESAERSSLATIQIQHMSELMPYIK